MFIALFLPETHPYESRLPEPCTVPEDKENGPCPPRALLSGRHSKAGYGSTSSSNDTSDRKSTDTKDDGESRVSINTREGRGSNTTTAEKKPKPHPMVALKYAGKNKLIAKIVLLVFFSQLCEAGIIELEQLYMRQQLHFETVVRSYAMVSVGLSTFLVMTFVFPFLSEYLSTTWLIVLSLTCKVAHAIVCILMF
jgi:hypothetical protein